MVDHFPVHGSVLHLSCGARAVMVYRECLLSVYKHGRGCCPHATPAPPPAPLVSKGNRQRPVVTLNRRERRREDKEPYIKVFYFPAQQLQGRYFHALVDSVDDSAKLSCRGMDRQQRTFADWTTLEVSEWLKDLPLSRDYSTAFQGERT